MIASAFEWFGDHAALTTVMLVGSILVFVVSLWLGHFFLVRMPADYFVCEHKAFGCWGVTHPALKWSLLVGKNLIGALLIGAGLVMFVTPGQGLLTLILGIALVDVPGKRRVEQWIVRRPTVLKVLNSLRKRAGQPPLVV